MPSLTGAATVGDLLPDLAVELASLLMEANEPRLAIEVPGLPVEWWCDCGKAYCQTFYTGPAPDPGAEGHRTVTFDGTLGTIAVELVEERIAVVVIHDRPDLAPRLARELSGLRPALRPA